MTIRVLDKRNKRSYMLICKLNRGGPMSASLLLGHSKYTLSFQFIVQKSEQYHSASRAVFLCWCQDKWCRLSFMPLSAPHKSKLLCVQFEPRSYCSIASMIGVSSTRQIARRLPYIPPQSTGRLSRGQQLCLVAGPKVSVSKPFHDNYGNQPKERLMLGIHMSLPTPCDAKV